MWVANWRGDRVVDEHKTYHRNRIGAQPADESQHCCFYKLNAISVMEVDAHRYNVAVSRNMRKAARFCSRSELFIKTTLKYTRKLNMVSGGTREC